MWNDMFSDIIEAIQTAIVDMVSGIVSFFPDLIVGIVILVVGWLIARLLRTILVRAGERAGLDKIIERAGLANMLRSANIKQSPTQIVGMLVYYFIMLNFLLAALKGTGLTEAVAPLEKLIDFLPTGIAALITFVIGVLFSQFIGNAVSGALESTGIDFHQSLGNMARLLMLAIVIVVVMEQVGLEVAIVTNIVTSTIILVIAGLALAFGLGGRTVTRNVLAGFYARELFTPGDRLRVDELEGFLEGIGTLNAEIRVGNDLITIPNTRLTEDTIRRIAN